MEDDKILLRLRRQYSENETIKLLSQQLSKAQFRIGELQSEVEELKYEVSMWQARYFEIAKKKDETD